MNNERNPPVVVAPARYVLLPLAQAITGYSVNAIQCKIHRGEWPEGKVWRRAPDGHIVIDVPDTTDGSRAGRTRPPRRIE